MSKVIIAIHGLGNKPPKSIFQKWLKISIRDGLKAINKPHFFFNFDIVYWADFFYPKTLDPGEKNKNNPFFLEEPYVKPEYIEVKKPSSFRKKILGYVEKQMDSIFLNEDMTINFSLVNDFIVRHFFKELDAYYSKTFVNSETLEEMPMKTVIRDVLIKKLRKYKDKEILLISHSMGTIIAYDVLTYCESDINIDTFVTLGSPLGLPIVMSKIAEELNSINGNKDLRVPESVKKNWYNLSDLHDKVSMNYDLADDYAENSKGIRVFDELVVNNYRMNGKKNPHKIYGYLRTPELAAIIDQFLTSGQTKMMNRVYSWVARIFR